MQWTLNFEFLKIKTNTKNYIEIYYKRSCCPLKTHFTSVLKTQSSEIDWGPFIDFYRGVVTTLSLFIGQYGRQWIYNVIYFSIDFFLNLCFICQHYHAIIPVSYSTLRIFCLYPVTHQEWWPFVYTPSLIRSDYPLYPVTHQEWRPFVYTPSLIRSDDLLFISRHSSGVTTLCVYPVTHKECHVLFIYCLHSWKLEMN